MSENQSTCCGCFLNPSFVDPFWYFGSQPQPIKSFQNPCDSVLSKVKLSEEEKGVLQLLGQAWVIFYHLDKKHPSDEQEFLKAIHQAQQLIAMRVARRVDPDVWCQPE